MSKKIDVGWQMFLAAFPFFINQAYAFHKVKKTKSGIVLLVLVHIGFIFLVMDYTIYDKLDLTQSASSSLSFVIVGILLAIPIYFVRKWTLEYNSNLITNG